MLAGAAVVIGVKRAKVFALRRTDVVCCIVPLKNIPNGWRGFRCDIDHATIAHGHNAGANPGALNTSEPQPVGVQIW